MGARANFDSLSGRGSGGTTEAAPVSAAEARPAPESIAREAEPRVQALLEASAAAAAAGDRTLALERAQEAGRAERALAKRLEDMGAGESVNTDLTYAVCVNLGLCYEGAGMPSEALRSYTLVVRNAEYPHSWRMRVNIGNLHAAAGDNAAALKQYRMALDRVPMAQRSLRARIQRNIGATLIRSGRYTDAVGALEGAMADAEAAAGGSARGRAATGASDGEAIEPDAAGPDDGDGGDGVGGLPGDVDAPEAFPCGYNLVACRFALGDGEGMMGAFLRLAALQLPLPDDSDDALGSGTDGGHGGHHPDNGLSAVGGNSDLSLTLSRYDSLSVELRARTRAAQALVLKAARLIAPVIAPHVPVEPGESALPRLLQQRTQQNRERGGRANGGGDALLSAGGGDENPALAWCRGYDWLSDALSQHGHPSLASEMRIVKALALMEVRERPLLVPFFSNLALSLSVGRHIHTSKLAASSLATLASFLTAAAPLQRGHRGTQVIRAAQPRAAGAGGGQPLVLVRTGRGKWSREKRIGLVPPQAAETLCSH